MPGAEPSARKRAFDPVVDGDTRLLILGSLPGEASLKAGQYYAHPQNGFWRLIGGVIGRLDLTGQPYAERLDILKAHGIGLWDVIAEAERIGSLDTAIRLPRLADLKGLIAALPRLEAIAFNGGKAAREGARVLGPETGNLVRLTLLSSSPAMARPIAWKANDWAVLRPFARPADVARDHMSHPKT
ncbi:MAG: DNA-deoxyinosine glycosylase [Brevundimonas sp.]|uniref:DNA-deoxyinosine glycosylase n=1 Tax=Brevundimonas sp. TaxID=1871086 RepID=UPI001A335E9C|nr:DNA-deoxyinosine glycosylase [Brevundimonas sp.]MBJ7448236.1 DNA-deoxyinosine glycosylase [Brevundimonas sp.]